MNKQEYLIITFHSLDDAMDLDAKQTSSMKGRLIPKPSVTILLLTKNPKCELR